MHELLLAQFGISLTEFEKNYIRTRHEQHFATRTRQVSVQYRKERAVATSIKRAETRRERAETQKQNQQFKYLQKKSLQMDVPKETRQRRTSAGSGVLLQCPTCPMMSKKLPHRCRGAPSTAASPTPSTVPAGAVVDPPESSPTEDSTYTPTAVRVPASYLKTTRKMVVLNFFEKLETDMREGTQLQIPSNVFFVSGDQGFRLHANASNHF